MDQFEIGEMYYRLTYPGRGLLYPQVASFIFLGLNLCEGDAGELNQWYFQFSETYANHGSALEATAGLKAAVCLQSKDLDEMLDIDGLIRELGRSKELRKKAADAAL